jgi:hypothetical protein
MSGFERFVDLAGIITRRFKIKTTRRGVNHRRQPLKPTALTLEDLETRIVPTLLGQQLFPADYPWNQNIANAPVASNSAAIISHIGSSIKIHPDWGDDSPTNAGDPLYGIPYNVVHGNSVAKVQVVIDNYPGESDMQSAPIPAGAVIEGDFQNGPRVGLGNRGDSHLIVWDEDNNIGYEFFQASRPSENADGKWHAAQESVWNMSTDSFRTLGDTSADAAGLSILAGLARPDEGLPAGAGGQGAINHALRFTLPSGDVNPQYIYPASHMVSTSSGSTKLPFGARLRLMNTPTVNAAISAMGPEAQIVAHAMQQYGLVLADIGSAMYVTGSSASQDANNNIALTWNMNDVLGLSALHASDFEVVDLTPQVTGLSAASGVAGNTVTVIGQNFSGAAGHLSVLFGGVPATSVTYVDDAHITAGVPAGSGTVHVQVQSGITATDPNNPNDNVTKPIFGYGTSATSAADQFAFITQTISGTNSTDSLASATTVSGTPDTLTIVVKDTTGAAVSGLPSGAFGFSLSGGTSAGSVGTVTETATRGTYTAAFTGTTAGTASTLTVTVSGVALTATSAVTVTAGAVNSTRCTLSFASASVASGGSDPLTLTIKDAAGNAVSGLAGTVFNLALSGGSSGGTFGPVVETATPGTYTSTFTGTTAGTASTLTATVSGVSLATRPTVTVSAGTVSGTMSSASFASPTVGADGTDTVTLLVRDSGGNAVSGLAGSAFTFALSGGASAGTFGSVTETTVRGTYIASFTGTATGTPAILTVTVNAVTLTTTPTITVGLGPSGTIATNVPLFAWAAVAGAGSYKLWLTDNTTGQATVISNLVGTSWTATQPLVLGDKYTWWVGAVSGQSVAWNSGQDFTIAPIGTGPSGTIASNVPVFTWTRVSGAASYKVWLTDQTTGQTVVAANLSGTSWTPAQPLTLGDNYTWWAAAVQGQTVAWSSAVNFRIAPTTGGPAGVIATNVPVFTWSFVTGATSYKVWLTDQTTGQTTLVPGLTGSSWTPAQPLTLGDDYTWWAGAVQGQTTTWSDSVDFRIAPTGSGPSGTIATNVPVFSWNSVTGAASYKIWLTDQTTGQTVVIPNLTSTSWSPSQPLALGDNYTWWVGAASGQAVAWDGALNFRIAPTATAPSGAVGVTTPVFAWNSVVGAASYKLWLTDQTAGQTQVVGNLTGLSWTPPNPLTRGDTYIWWVGAVTAGGAVAWDSPLTFTI